MKRPIDKVACRSMASQPIPCFEFLIEKKYGNKEAIYNKPRRSNRLKRSLSQHNIFVNKFLLF